MVFDPFAGSCVTGEVAEKLNRKYTCVDNVDDYLKGAIGRFNYKNLKTKVATEDVYYKIPRPVYYRKMKKMEMRYLKMEGVTVLKKIIRKSINLILIKKTKKVVLNQRLFNIVY